MYTKQNTLSFFSQSGTHSGLVNVFGDSIASGPRKSTSGEESCCNRGQV